MKKDQYQYVRRKLRQSQDFVVSPKDLPALAKMHQLQTVEDSLTKRQKVLAEIGNNNFRYMQLKYWISSGLFNSSLTT